MLYNILKSNSFMSNFFLKASAFYSTVVEFLQINVKCFEKIRPLRFKIASIINTIMPLLFKRNILACWNFGREGSLFVTAYIYSFHYDHHCNFHYFLIYYTFTFPLSLMNELQTLTWYFIFVTGCISKNSWLLEFQAQSNKGAVNYRPGLYNRFWKEI